MDVNILALDRNVLLVGNAARVFTDYQQLVGTDFHLMIIPTVDEALVVVKKTNIQVLIVDQHLGEKYYLPFLSTLRKSYPDLIVILGINANDATQLILTINKVHIDRIVALPSNHEELIPIITDAFEQHDRLVSNKQSVSKLSAFNKKLIREVEAARQELKIVYEELRYSIEDNQKNISFIEAIYNSVPGLLYLFDHTGKLVRWNKEFNTLLGYTDQELLNMQIKDLFRGDVKSRAKVEAAMQKLALEGYVEVEAFLSRKNGSYIPMHFTATPVQIGGLPYFTGIGVDVSQRDESNRQLSALVSNLPGFVYGCANDEDWTMFYISDVCKTVTGYKPEDLIQNKKLSFNKIIHPDYQEILHRKWRDSLATNTSFEYEYQIITASGETRWVWEQGFGVRNGNGIITHLEGFVQDITVRKNTQKALNDSEEKFRTLFREMNDLAMFCSSEMSIDGKRVHFKIEDCNDAFLHAFNMELNDVIGKSPLELMGIGNSSLQENLIAAVRSNVNYSFTTDIINIDKRFQMTVVPVHSGSFAIIASDITALTRFNNVLMEKNNELENYVYVTSHDLRSPLVNIQGFSSRLKKQTDIISKIVESCPLESEEKAIVMESIEQKIPNTLDFIFNNVNKMEEMLNGLLQLSRTGRVTMHISQVDMRGMIVKVLQAADHQLHEISSEIVFGDLPNCYGDESMLNQLFSNLISNAIKYRNPEQKLKVSIDGIMRYRKVLYRVQDNGIGIAKMYLDKIWQVFFRVDNKQQPGDGVGLSLVKRIIEKHKGKIWVESTEHIGSTFFIELPAKDFTE